MENKKIIISIGGNIKSEEGTHPVKVAMKAISYFKDYLINVTNQSSWYETEPGGAVALAAAIFKKIDIRDKNVLVIASGGNVDKDIFENCLNQQEI